MAEAARNAGPISDSMKHASENLRAVAEDLRALVAMLRKTIEGFDEDGSGGFSMNEMVGAVLGGIALFRGGEAATKKVISNRRDKRQEKCSA